MPDFVTTIEIRQKGVSHDVAFQRAIDAAERVAGLRDLHVRIRPTLPDEPLSSPEEIEEFFGDGESDA